MRRLQVLPCPESWDRMRSDGEGRHCDRCQLRVTEVAKLDDDGLEQLAAAAERGRVCARFEVEGGRARTKLGLAAGLLVIALAGCATPDTAPLELPDEQKAANELLFEELRNEESSGGTIAGYVRSTDGLPLANAIVILISTALDGGQQERLTDERGVYKFKDLPPGNYAIQASYAKAATHQVGTLPENGRFLANFTLNPEGMEIILGMIDENTTLTNSPASSYSSKLLEYY